MHTEVSGTRVICSAAEFALARTNGLALILIGSGSLIVPRPPRTVALFPLPCKTFLEPDIRLAWSAPRWPFPEIVVQRHRHAERNCSPIRVSLVDLGDHGNHEGGHIKCLNTLFNGHDQTYTDAIQTHHKLL